MSFALTTNQIRNRTKTVTRRLGWKFLKEGDMVQAVGKSLGLGPGEHVEPLATLRIIEVRREPLRDIVDCELPYGFLETAREGFSDGALADPLRFVDWFALSHRCSWDTIVTRIEFEYVSP